MEECDFIGEDSLKYLKKQQSKNENIRLYELDAFSFMMIDLDAMEKKIHSTPKDGKGAEVEKTITAGMIQSAVNHEMKREAEERREKERLERIEAKKKARSGDAQAQARAKSQKEINRQKLAAARKADAEKYGDVYTDVTDDDLE